MKLISYSLYGNLNKFNVGALENAIQARDLLPDWKQRFYVEEGTSESTIRGLQKLDVELKIMKKSSGHAGMFWRFQPVADHSLERVLIRDCDSRISEREIKLIELWLQSNSPLHIIRDHPMHDAPILGGLWGIIPKSLPTFSRDLSNYSPKGFYGEDQDFLAKNVYSHLKEVAMIHDAYFNRESNRVRIQIPRTSGEFVGESFDSEGNPNLSHRRISENAESSMCAQRLILAKSYMRSLLKKW